MSFVEFTIRTSPSQKIMVRPSSVDVITSCYGITVMVIGGEEYEVTEYIDDVMRKLEENTNFYGKNNKVQD